MSRTIKNGSTLAAGLVGFLLASASVHGADVKVDPAFPDYKPVRGVSGLIQSVGSDTMNNLMTLWSEGFRKYYPNVQFEVEGKGSSTAMPALIEGQSTFGPMSRQAKSSEIDKFQSAFGYKPTQLPTAIDLLAVYVNKDNPIAKRGLTLAQVDAIFSSNRLMGYSNDVTAWGGVGLKDPWASKPISLYGRNAASGTYGFFKKVVLGGGDFKSTTKEQPGSAAVIQGVANDASGIGYSGIGYKTADVATVPLAEAEGSEFIAPTADNAFTGEYPLARFLLLAVNYKPGTELRPVEREFLIYIYTREGQQAVLKDGYYPVTPRVARQSLKAVGIDPNF